LPEKPKVKIRKSSYLTEQAGGGDQAIMLKAVDGLRFMERLVGSNVFEDVLEGLFPSMHFPARPPKRSHSE